MLLVVSVGASWVILMGSIDLSNGAIVLLSSLIVGSMVETWGYPVWLSVLGGVVVGGICGAINGALFAYVRLPSFLVTLGMSLIITGVGLTIVGGRTVQIFNLDFTAISQGHLVSFVPNIVIWSLVVYLIASLIGFRTKFGRYISTIGGGEQVAALSGIPVRRFKLYCFVVAGLLAGFAGVLLTARLSSGSPGAGSNLVLLSIAAVVMSGTPLTGGVGGVHRSILGVLVISMLENGLSGMGVGPFERSIIQGVVVILAVASTMDHSRLSLLK